MKQIVRRVIDRKGRIVAADLPVPALGPHQALVQNHYSLISTGTELSTLSKTPLELVRQTLSDPWMRHIVQQAVFTRGVSGTAELVRHEMVVPREIGYSGAGRVLAVGDAVEGVRIGDKVAYAATGHAEVVAPTLTHLVKVPETVDLRHAAFVTIGGIALQSIRRSDLRLGEVVAVYGLGLVGQMCAAIARAAGCAVIGIDLDPQRNELARQLGAELVINPGEPDWQRRISDRTGKHGVDATIICASSKSETIINSSMEITRKQGRVVLVGYVKLDIHPKNFLYKEIDLRYSRAYGPGSYDRAYDSGRVDYPYGYVRWTEQRNLAEVIRLMETGAIPIEPLIGREYALSEAQQAFDALSNGTLGGIAALLRYDGDHAAAPAPVVEIEPRPRATGKTGVSLIGVGNHAIATHLPNLQKLPNAELRGLVSGSGKAASAVGGRAKATILSSNVNDVLSDPGTDAVIISSRQSQHFEHLKAAIPSGRAIYVEKPLVTQLPHFVEIDRLVAEHRPLITLGLNRRYSPAIAQLRDAMGDYVDAIVYTVAVPLVPPDHWTLDPIDGGGRLISEGEHFLDLCHVLAGVRPISVSAHPLGDPPDDLRTLCNFTVTVRYPKSVATVVFNESGPGFPRERITAFGRAKVGVLDDFTTLTIHQKKTRVSRSKQQMGHLQALEQFIAACRGEPNSCLTWPESRMATLSMFAAQESLRTGVPVDLESFEQSLRDSDAGSS